MRRDDCPECLRLWREYADATSTHIGLDSKLRLATLEWDLPSIELLTPEVEAAGARRTFYREAFRKHVATTHKADAETNEYSGDIRKEDGPN